MKVAKYKIDGTAARALVKRSGLTMSGVSLDAGYSDSWFTKVCASGNIYADDLERLRDNGLDLTPYIVSITGGWVQRTDIGIVFDTIILSYEGKTCTEIATALGIDYKTVRRYIATWEETHFHIKQKQMETLLKKWREE